MRALAVVWRVGFASQAGAEEFSRPAWVGEELPLCARAPPLNSPTQTEEDRRLLTRGLGSEATRWVVRALQPAAGGASRVVVAPSLHSLYSAASSAGQYELEAQVGPGKMLLWCADPERVLKTLKPIQGLPEPTRKCAFRTKAITDSGACRSPIPTEADHRFRSMPIAERTVM